MARLSTLGSRLLTVVPNAGPLIALARIGQLDLLRTLCGELRIPPPVYHEVAVPDGTRSGALEVRSATWIHVNEVCDHTAVELLGERLGAGESAAIVLGLEQGADLLLMDEARGRRVAESRGLKVTGTLGLIVEAKQRGLLRAVTPLMDALLAAGFRMSEGLYETARLLAGER